MNNFTFTGRLGKDPEQRQTQSGKLLCSFTVGVRTSRKMQDGSYATFWVNCQAWEQQARYILQTAKKGSFFTGSGEFRTEKYQGQDGTEKTYSYVLLNDGTVATPILPPQNQVQAPVAPVAPAPQNMPQVAPAAPVAPVAPAPTVAPAPVDPLGFGGTDNVQLPFEI